MSPADRLRIGDAERDEAVDALGEHFAAGRLTRVELDERTSLAWSARTAADLGPLFADLPAPHGPVPGAAPWTSAPWTSATWASATWTPQPRRARRNRRPFPWLVFLVALVVLTALTDVPWLLLALALWFVLSRTRGWARPPWVDRWSGHARHRGCGPRSSYP